MTADFSDDDNKARLLQLSKEVTRIAAALADLSLEIDPASADRAAPAIAPGEIPARSVNWVFQARRARARFFPEDMFSEPVWDMLLDLFRCELRGGRLSTSDLCLAAGVPTTTALRWISAMAEKGLVTREPDRHDARRVFIALAPETRSALERYFAEVIDGK